MKNILIPTDFSEQADNAVQVASYIARQSGARVHLLHVMDVSMGGGFNAMGDVSDYTLDHVYVIKLMEINKKRLHATADELLAQGINAVYDVQVGNIFTSITSLVERLQIDLIVMGTKGSSGIDEFLIGSNAEKIVRRSHCPVLSVRELQPNFKIKDIVFASNFENDQLPAVSKMKKFQEFFGANIHLLYINVPSRFTNTRLIRQHMNDFVQRYQLTNYDFSIYNDSSEEEGIIHFADETKADIIAVATHGRTGLAHLISGSIAEDIVNHAHRPVLTFNLKGLEEK